ncbi:asparagine synthase-related protein [Anderseniella sp. Alg231-50]|uniref:asparagine synthase-related protein n=1 Tax=Anderseniella sp. Alg231-50 TaxID=1922226 RepID=UPI000D551205
MTGLIAGLISLTGRNSSNVAEKLAAALKDSASCTEPEAYCDDHAVLLQCDLRAPGEASRAGRPITADPKIGVLACDHRLYNHLELADDMGLGRDVGMSGVLAGTLATHGDHAAGLALIDGDFALALWNPDTRSLLLGRDGVGVRPLFYSYRPGEYLAFASLQSVLCAAGFASDAPDRDAVVRLAVGDHNTGEQTFLRDVRRVMPGTMLVFENDQVRSQTFWKLKPGKAISASIPATWMADELRVRLQDAVRRRLPEEGPAATHLSGGLDSSAISVLAARALRARGDTVHGYSIQARRRCDVDIVDGAPYASVTAQAEENLRAVAVDALPFGALATGNVALGEPVLSHEDDPYERIAGLAGAAGHGPILSGFGGDHLVSFNGRGDLSEYLLKLKWRRLARELDAHREKTGRPAWKTLAADIGTHVLPQTLSDGLRNKFGSVEPPVHSLADFMNDATVSTNSAGPTTRQNRLALLNNGSIPVGLELLARQAARHGTSYAFPFLDRNLMDYALRLPTEVFRVDGVGRWIFRQAMVGVLPESVRTNTQRLPLSPCKVLEAAEAKPAFRETLNRLRKVDDLPFDLDRIEQAIDDLPDPEKRVHEVNRCAARGEIADESAVLFTLPLFLGRYLARQASV